MSPRPKGHTTRPPEIQRAQITYYGDPEARDKLAEIAAEKGLSISSAMREAVMEWILKNKKFMDLKR